jgi:lipopolysaccharide transport system ATP-binding protein
MSDFVIKVENLGKKYSIRHEQRERYTALRDVIAHGAKRMARVILSPRTKNHKRRTTNEERFFLVLLPTRDIQLLFRWGRRVWIQFTVRGFFADRGLGADARASRQFALRLLPQSTPWI